MVHIAKSSTVREVAFDALIMRILEHCITELGFRRDLWCSQQVSWRTLRLVNAESEFLEYLPRVETVR